jgi:hypothetical protein
MIGARYMCFFMIIIFAYILFYFVRAARPHNDLRAVYVLLIDIILSSIYTVSPQNVLYW